jgi:hypothetical protein
MEKVTVEPTLLGAVAGTATSDTPALTAAGFSPRGCDWMEDYIRLDADQPDRADSSEI